MARHVTEFVPVGRPTPEDFLPVEIGYSNGTKFERGPLFGTVRISKGRDSIVLDLAMLKNFMAEQVRAVRIYKLQGMSPDEVLGMNW